MKTMALILVLAVAAPIALTGCDRTVETKTTSKTDSDGSSKVEKKTVTQTPGGDTTVTQEKKTVDTH